MRDLENLKQSDYEKRNYLKNCFLSVQADIAPKGAQQIIAAGGQEYRDLGLGNRRSHNAIEAGRIVQNFIFLIYKIRYDSYHMSFFELFFRKKST